MSSDIKISASILNANFMQLGREIDAIADMVDELHLDVLDGHFAPNISFGAPVLAGLRERFPTVQLDTHLMITNPEAHIEAFRNIGSNIISFHIEMTHRSYALLQRIRAGGMQAGIALGPATDARLLEPLRACIDRVLVMTVEPGHGGQSLIPETLTKVAAIRKLCGDEVDIQVDGGINADTIGAAKRAGANVFVVGSYIFSAPDKSSAIEELHTIIRG